MRSTHLRALIGAALAIPIALLSTSALANESLEVKSGDTVVLDGTVHFQTITVRGGGKLVVRPRAMDAPGSGTLTIKADAVTVEKDGVIDATGAGYEGTTGAGLGPGMSGGGQGKAGNKAAPGGGGASGGDGASGCSTANDGGDGGKHFGAQELTNPGASGGASFFPNSPDVPNRGGRGGGAVMIHAAEVKIDGAILADGAPGLSYGGVGTGGGAGGYVNIDAYTLTGTGTISAKGGAGGDGFSANGGGGGGGTIQISIAKPLQNGVPTRVIGGGMTGKGCLPGGKGIDEVMVDMAKPCLDADGDGDPAASCGGKDCDDSDPKVHGGAKPAVEVCDGEDNDCDGSVDDNLVADACPEDQRCQGGVCVAENGGSSGAGSGGAAAPDYLDYRGACDVGTSPHRNGMVFFASALLAFLAGLRAQRKNRRR
jgi:hypothetical protein